MSNCQTVLDTLSYIVSGWSKFFIQQVVLDLLENGLWFLWFSFDGLDLVLILSDFIDQGTLLVLQFIVFLHQVFIFFVKLLDLIIEADIDSLQLIPIVEVLFMENLLSLLEVFFLHLQLLYLRLFRFYFEFELEILLLLLLEFIVPLHEFLLAFHPWFSQILLVFGKSVL